MGILLHVDMLWKIAAIRTRLLATLKIIIFPTLQSQQGNYANVWNRNCAVRVVQRAVVDLFNAAGLPGVRFTSEDGSPPRRQLAGARFLETHRRRRSRSGSSLPCIFLMPDVVGSRIGPNVTGRQHYAGNLTKRKFRRRRIERNGTATSEAVRFMFLNTGDLEFPSRNWMGSRSRLLPENTLRHRQFCHSWMSPRRYRLKLCRSRILSSAAL